MFVPIAFPYGPKRKCGRKKTLKHVGAWRSPVAYSLGVRVVGRSNRLAPTKMLVVVRG